MTWEQLSAPWQAAFAEAWNGYCAGSLPIGCAIADREDTILFTGRNRAYETLAPGNSLSGNQLAHAEMNALAPLRPSEIDPRTCVLYTTLEPCPMCAGAIRMMGIGALHFAARDPLAGSTALFATNAYMRRSGVAITGPATPELEATSVALTVAAFLELHAGTDLPVRIMTHFQAVVPDAVRLGQLVHDTGMLQRLRDQEYPVDRVFLDLLGEFQPSG